jgi:glycosyltransferase involved in cell wall biosynthesis
MNAAMARKGAQVDVYTTAAGLEGKVVPNQATQLDGVRVTYFSFLKCFEFFGPTGWQFSPALRSSLERNISNYNIVFVVSAWNYPVLAAHSLCRDGHKPYVLSTRGILCPYMMRKKRWKKLIYYNLFLKQVIRDASAMHYCSVDEADQTSSCLSIKTPFFVVPNGIELGDFSSLPDKAGISLRYPELKGKRIVLSLGRLHEKKGLDILVRAFGSLFRKIPGLHLLLAGNDESGYLAKVKGMLEAEGIAYNDYTRPGSPKNPDACVTITGFLSGEDKLAALSAGDIFVLPSYSENFGVAVAEAMACGLPVIVSDQVAVHKEVSASGCGLVVKADHAELAGAMERLLGNPELMKDMSGKGRIAAARFFDINKNAQAMIEELQAVIKRQGSL